MTTTHTRSLWHDWRELGDDRAFENLVVREVPYAADLVRRMGASAAEADDAVQESLLKLAREASDEPLEVGLRAWICRRAALAFKMHVRASGRRRTHEQAASVVPSAQDSDGPVELGKSVNEALADLPADQRLALVLRHMHDMDYAEIAHVLGVSRNAARLRVFRGLAALRRTLGTEAATMVAMVGVPPFALSTAPAVVAGGVAATAAGASLGTKAAVGAAALLMAAGTAAVLLSQPEPSKAPEPVPVVSAPPPTEETRPTPPATPVRVVGPALALLDAHLSGTRDATDTLWDVTAVDDLMGSPAGETKQLAPGAQPISLRVLEADTGRIEFGPGTYVVTQSPQVGDRGVLELIGAGSDRTTLVFRGGHGIEALGDLAGLRVRGMTIEGGTFLRVKGRVAAVFDDVRFRGWQDRGGYGAPVGVGGSALLAFRNCAFLGGYRRRPAGTGLSVRGACLAVFDNCTFHDLAQVVANGRPGDPHPRGIAHFDACSFEASPLVRNDDRAEDAYPMRVRGGRIAFGLARFPRERRLQALGADRVDLAKDVPLVPEPARVTLAQVRAALAAMPREGEDLVALEARRHPDDAHTRIITYGRGERRMRALATYRWKDGALVPLPPDAERTGHAPALVPGQGATLRELLDEAWPELDPQESSGGVALHRRSDGTAVLVLLDRFGRQRR